MRRVFWVSIIAVFVCIFAEHGAAQSKTTVKFPRGSTETTVNGTVRGYAYRDYVLGAKAGQTMELALTATPSSSVFTVFMPNKDNLDGASQMNDFSGELPVSGNYVIRVGMMRSAARRKGSVSNFTLRIVVK